MTETPSETFIAQNPLEESLVSAVKDPAARPQFYRDLVASDIFVLRDGPPPTESGEILVGESDELHLRMIEWNGKPVIPIFSSLERLQVILQEAVGYLTLNALEFMKLTVGVDLVLNPGSEYGKEFVKEEISSIIDGSIWEPGERREVASDTQVLIGQPSEYPQDLVDALVRLFEKSPSVLRAYVAHIIYPEQSEQGHTLLAIEASEDWEDVAKCAGMVVRDVPCPAPPVDIMQIAGRGGVEEYFVEEAVPFYEKKSAH